MPSRLVTIRFAFVLAFGALTPLVAQAQTIVASEFVLAPRVVLSSTALVGPQRGVDGPAASPSSAPDSAVGHSVPVGSLPAIASATTVPQLSILGPPSSSTIALSAGVLEKKAGWNSASRLLEPLAGASGPATLGQRVGEAITALFQPESGLSSGLAVNTTGLPQLPTMSDEH